MSGTQRTVGQCGVRVTYTLERKHVKNINLRVRPEGVFVSAPNVVPVHTVDEFVRAKAGFILSAQKRFEERLRSMPAPMQYESGETYPILGKELRLAVITSDDERVRSDGEFIYIYVRDTEDTLKKQRLFNDWVLRRCEKVFGDTAERVYEKMKQYGLPKPSIIIKDMKSRWGSCMPSGATVTLNRQLIKAPPECIEYVVVHEFAHLLHPDHSPAFHAFVGTVLPDWKERDRRLKQVVITKGQ